MTNVLITTLNSPSNWFAFLALLFYLATFLPGFAHYLFPRIKIFRIIRFTTKYRRQIGLMAFFLAFIHGALIILERKPNLLDLTTALKYAQGLTMTLIFTILAITSNNWSIKNFRKNWHRLHRLTYLVILILPWHILDKVDEWTIFTPIALILIFITIPLLVWKLIVVYRKKPEFLL